MTLLIPCGMLAVTVTGRLHGNADSASSPDFFFEVGFALFFVEVEVFDDLLQLSAAEQHYGAMSRLSTAVGA